MSDHEKHDHKHDHKDDPGRAVAALFQTKAEGKAAIAALHKAKMTHTWFGTTSIAATSTGDEAVTVESGGFFSGTESLVEALVSHGVLGDEARELEGQIQAGNVVVSVDPKDHGKAEAIDLLTHLGGRVANGSSADWGAWPASSTMGGSDTNLDDEFEEVYFARR